MFSKITQPDKVPQALNRADTPITIIGAGIAGLTAALCLAKLGFPVSIHEKRASLALEGAGIQLTPNALRVFDHLGLANLLTEQGTTPHDLTVFSGPTGKQITKMPLGPSFAARHGLPYLLIQRQNLIETLYRAATQQKIRLHFGKAFDASHNSEIPIIGADGLWSNVRSGVNTATACYTGRTAYRATIAPERVPLWIKQHGLMIALGPDAHFVAYPVNRDGTLNLVCVIKMPAPKNRWSAPASVDEVRAALTGWNQPLCDLLPRAENWCRWPLSTIAPSHAWTKNKTVLIGDAAHAMLPFLAQGGAMAIEDAAVLAHALAQSTSIETAFSHYQKERQGRVRRIFSEAWQNGERYHWHGLKAAARNLGLKAMGGEGLQQRYDWIYRWQPPQQHACT